MPIVIRAAAVEDSRAIAEIHVAGWRVAYRGHMPDDFLAALSVDRRTEHHAKGIGTPRTPEHRTWVALADGRVVAFAITGPSRDEGVSPGVAELFAIYAEPARWGTGAGRALAGHVLADLRARGTSEVTLWVLDGNARARRFYEIAGFRTDGAEKTGTFGAAELRELRYRLSL